MLFSVEAVCSPEFVERFQRRANADNQQHKHQNAQSHHDVLAEAGFCAARFLRLRGRRSTGSSSIESSSDS